MNRKIRILRRELPEMITQIIRFIHSNVQPEANNSEELRAKACEIIGPLIIAIDRTKPLTKQDFNYVSSILTDFDLNQLEKQRMLRKKQNRIGFV